MDLQLITYRSKTNRLEKKPATLAEGVSDQTHLTWAAPALSKENSVMCEAIFAALLELCNYFGLVPSELRGSAYRTVQMRKDVLTGGVVWPAQPIWRKPSGIGGGGSSTSSYIVGCVAL
eukprot:3554983-Pleurochrysis_carterae.AAC.5